MELMFSISGWYNFIVERLLLDAIFIPTMILIGFAFFNRKEYRNTKMLRFILSALVLSLIIPYIHFVYMDMKINTRYLYTATFYVIILCVPGFFLILCLLKYIFQKNDRVKEKHLIIFLLLIIGIGSICKALGPPDKKHYIHDAAKIIKASPDSIVMSNLRDSKRIAWHSNAELLPLSSVTDIENPIDFENALNILSSRNKNIFLFVKCKNDKFRKFFSEKKIAFPAKLILLKEFKAKQKRFYSLYKVKTSETF